MALGKHSNTMGGLFGGRSGSQSGVSNNQSQQFQDPSQQSYSNDPTLQQYVEPSSIGGAPFESVTQDSYAFTSTQVLYTDATTGQTFYTDSTVGTQQSYTDPSYGTQAYTVPSYDSVGQSYVPIDQSYGSDQTYYDSTVDTTYAPDPQQGSDAWQEYDMSVVTEGSEQIADTYADSADSVADVMDGW
jgi:hypothetical protein